MTASDAGSAAVAGGAATSQGGTSGQGASGRGGANAGSSAAGAESGRGPGDDGGNGGDGGDAGNAGEAGEMQGGTGGAPDAPGGAPHQGGASGEQGGETSAGAGGTSGTEAGSGGTAAGAAGTSGGGGSGGGGSGGAAGNAASGAGGTAGDSTGSGGTASAGNAGTGASSGTAGTTAGSGGTGSGAGGSAGANCAFSVDVAASPHIPSVGIVEWSTTLAGVSRANVVYELDGAGDDVLNRGGAAPVELAGERHRTLLLGLKPERTYTVHVEAETADGTRCRSEGHTLATGALAGAPSVTRTAPLANAQARGFIVTCGGVGSRGPVIIVDADGDVVWTAPAPDSCSRARIDYEGKRLWMLAINPANRGGDLRSISMDGAEKQASLPGLERAHHDLAVLPGGRIAVFAWIGTGYDPESDLLEWRPDGSVTRLFRVGGNLYAGGQSVFGGSAQSYHCNSITYLPDDDSFTIGDRNPNLFVKVSRSGTPVWQFGGSCSAARAPRCVPGSWRVNHGHHLLDDGTFVFFSNADWQASTPSSVEEFQLDMSEAPSASARGHWPGAGNEHSDTLGDAERLPNGNTLVTFSNNGMIYELDPDWNVVQTLRATSFGYTEWRESLYGPPWR
ncbi:MAG TPA: aryl-sulfate sulfotransferase [Polyangiaceae bacterium]